MNSPSHTYALLEDLLSVLHHEIHKPYASLKMFFQVFDHIAQDPSECRSWERSLLTSFPRVIDLIDDLNVLHLQHISCPVPFAVQDALVRANNLLEAPTFHFCDDCHLNISGDLDLFARLFVYLALSTEQTIPSGPVFYPVFLIRRLCRPGPTENGAFTLRVINSLSDSTDNTSTPLQRLHTSLAAKIAALHDLSLEKINVNEFLLQGHTPCSDAS